MKINISIDAEAFVASSAIFLIATAPFVFLSNSKLFSYLWVVACSSFAHMFYDFLVAKDESGE